MQSETLYVYWMTDLTNRVSQAKYHTFKWLPAYNFSTPTSPWHPFSWRSPWNNEFPGHRMEFQMTDHRDYHTIWYANVRSENDIKRYGNISDFTAPSWTGGGGYELAHSLPPLVAIFSFARLPARPRLDRDVAAIIYRSPLSLSRWNGAPLYGK